MDKAVKTQWHPAFCSAIQLELCEDSDYLQCISEYNLNTKPLQVDFLIIKKIEEIIIKNAIGKIFRKHNLLEYKSPDDDLNVDSFIKVIGYACLYKAQEAYVDEIALEDITITLVRKRYPRKLFKWFRKHGYYISEEYPGIYYVNKEDSFPIQVIISARVSNKELKWLSLLSGDLTQDDVKRAVCQMNNLVEYGEKEHADSVLQVIMQENKDVFEKMKKGDEDMCDALRQLMEPELREAKEKAMAEGRAEGRAEGKVEGREEGRLLNMFHLVQKNLLTKEIAAQETGVSVVEFVRMMNEYGYSLL